MSKNKSISLRWKLDSILMQTLKKNFCSYYHHGHLITCLRTKKGKGRESLSSAVTNKPVADGAFIPAPPPPPLSMLRFTGL